MAKTARMTVTDEDDMCWESPAYISYGWMGDDKGKKNPKPRLLLAYKEESDLAS
jgi:hypothetical protein